MHVTIGKTRFDVDPLGAKASNTVSETAIGREKTERKFYVWNCAEPEKSKAFEPIDANGFLSFDPFVAFAEPEFRRPRQSPNATKTLAMKLRVLGTLRFAGIDDLTTVMKRFLGDHKVKIDMSSFDWLKPHASFEVWMHVEYHYIEFSNKTLSLRYLVGIPHRIRLKAEIIGFCDPKGLIKDLKAGKKLKVADLGLTGEGSKLARVIRRAVLRKKLAEIQPPPVPFPGFSPNDSTVFGGSGDDFFDGGKKSPPKFTPSQKKQRKKLKDAIDLLEKMEDENDNPEGE